MDPTNMGEAKVLVEMELDRDFPKLIALDDKQGNIYLVEVDYTWIPSTCERCSSLGHKAKRCLLSSKPPEYSSSVTASADDTADIPVVDIDHILQQKEIATSSSPKKDVTLPEGSTNASAYDASHDQNEIDGLHVNSEARLNAKAAPFLPDLETDHELLSVTPASSKERQKTKDTRNTTTSSFP